MSDENEINRDDIPQVEDLKAAILAELASGRARSFEAVQKDVAAQLNLSTKQRRYKIKGSKTTLLSNRFEKARAELKTEGLVEYPSHGKIKLVQQTPVAKPAPAKPQTPETNATTPPPATLPQKPGERAGSQPPHVQPTAPLPKAAPQMPTSAPHPAPYTVPTKPEVPASNASSTPKGSWSTYRTYAPIALVVLGLLLCLMQLGLPGAILGGAGLFLKAKDSKNSDVRNPAAPKTTLWVGIASIFLGLVLAISSCSGSVNTPASQDNAPESPSASSQEAPPDEAKGVLSFKVTAADWPDKSTSVRVQIEGKTADGKSVSDHYTATIGTSYPLTYGAGDYTFTIAQGSLVCNDIPFKTSPSQCTFDGAKDKVVTLTLTKDEAAIKAAEKAAAEAEAERQAAEAAAQEEAERQAAEEAAAAQAEAERQAAEAAAAAAAAAQAQSAAEQPSGGGEYIGNVNTHKFHLPSCGSLPMEKNQIYFSSRDEAINSGYVPCKKCRP